MRNSLRTSLVGLLSVMMLVNPAAACHFCGGGGAGSPWGGGYQPYGYSPAYYGPVSYGGGCGGCGGAVVVVDECSGCQPCGGCGSSEGVVKESAPAESTNQPAPAAPIEAVSELPAAAPTQPQQPAHVDRPVDNTPAPTLPPAPAPASSDMPPLPDNENSPPPMPPANDLFNSAPAATPPAAAPAAVTPPQAETPAVPAERPTESNDLFGSPAETPAEKPAVPAETPAETPAAPDATPAETPAAAPATPPAATDDLFGAPAATPAETPATPAETPAAPEAKPAEAPAATPAGEEKKDEKKKDDTDIFGASPTVLREAGGLASNEMREWTDNTGSFSCQARLVRFLDGQVRLLKDNGRTTTVSLARLSVRDLEFVERQASAQQASAFQTAQAMSVLPGLAN